MTENEKAKEYCRNLSHFILHSMKIHYGVCSLWSQLDQIEIGAGEQIKIKVTIKIER